MIKLYLFLLIILFAKYDIFYINLKERTERKEEIEKEFGKLENKKYLEKCRSIWNH